MASIFSILPPENHFSPEWKPDLKWLQPNGPTPVAVNLRDITSLVDANISGFTIRRYFGWGRGCARKGKTISSFGKKEDEEAQTTTDTSKNYFKIERAVTLSGIHLRLHVVQTEET